MRTLGGLTIALLLTLVPGHTQGRGHEEHGGRGPEEHGGRGFGGGYVPPKGPPAHAAPEHGAPAHAAPEHGAPPHAAARIHEPPGHPNAPYVTQEGHWMGHEFAGNESRFHLARQFEHGHFRAA